MKNNFLRILFVVFIAVAMIQCSETESFAFDHETTYRNGKLFKNKNSEPFSGKVLRYYENGSLASEAHYCLGIPCGKWIVYGYVGDIIQFGNYLSSSEVAENVSKALKGREFDVAVFNEGEMKYLDVSIWFGNSPIDSLTYSLLSDTIAKDLWEHVGKREKVKNILVKSYEGDRNNQLQKMIFSREYEY